MLKNFAIFGFSVLVFVGCTAPLQPTATTNANISPQKTADDSPVISAHSQPSNLNDGAPQNSAVVVPKSETKTKWTQSGNPVDVSEFDAEIARAEKNLKVKPKDAQARKSTAEAYLKRAVVLTDARQYASALGDYRRVLKYDAENEDAKNWIKQILEIYERMNKEAPSEGEEPPPLPFDKKG